MIGGRALAVVLVALSWTISWVTYRGRIMRGLVLLRKQGIHHFHETYSAILEADGTLSLIRMSEREAMGQPRGEGH